ncbi:MAG: hypothetical protein CVU77_04480 [Elusimicrobia bacterium HGW-Elusimicrobia-1]|jgi:hypothetical protein|nr:MAG: hypothetical protein CVU77_04480 [Elusimicrobia bacterium HGW-Elusimicrobia-1]
MRTIKALSRSPFKPVVSLEKIKGMLVKLYEEIETGATEVQKAVSCRDLLLVGLLSCHMLRPTTLPNLRLRGRRGSITRRGGTGKWYLALYPGDSKCLSRTVRFPLMSCLVKAHELWISRYRSVLAGDGIAKGRYLVCECGRALGMDGVHRLARSITKRLLDSEIVPYSLRLMTAAELVRMDDKNRRAVARMLLYKEDFRDAHLISVSAVENELQKIDEIWDNLKGA